MNNIGSYTFETLRALVAEVHAESKRAKAVAAEQDALVDEQVMKGGVLLAHNAADPRDVEHVVLYYAQGVHQTGHLYAATHFGGGRRYTDCGLELY